MFNLHVENFINSAKQLSGTWQHHRNPSSVHLGCYWLFINTIQTVQCGCIWNRKKNKSLEQVNTSFIISFVWCVYCVLFLVDRSCLTVLRKGEETFLKLYPFVLSVEEVFFLPFSFYCNLSMQNIFLSIVIVINWQVQMIMNMIDNFIYFKMGS